MLNLTATIFEIDKQKTQILNPIERPEIMHRLSENIVLTAVDDLYNWARLSSLWYMLFEIACFIELTGIFAASFDFDWRIFRIPQSGECT